MTRISGVSGVRWGSESSSPTKEVLEQCAPITLSDSDKVDTKAKLKAVFKLLQDRVMELGVSDDIVLVKDGAFYPFDGSTYCLVIKRLQPGETKDSNAKGTVFAIDLSDDGGDTTIRHGFGGHGTAGCYFMSGEERIERFPNSFPTVSLVKDQFEKFLVSKLDIRFNSKLTPASPTELAYSKSDDPDMTVLKLAREWGEDYKSSAQPKLELFGDRLPVRPLSVSLGDGDQA